MSKTRWIYVLKTISSNKVPFIVLLVFSCIATMMYASISWSGMAIEGSVYGFCGDHRLYDISVTSPVGFTEDGIERILEAEGVDEAEGVYLAYGLFSSSDMKFAAKVSSVTEAITIPSVTEGTLPRGTNEIAIEGKWAKRKGISVGDVISTDGDLKCQALCESVFTVTALLETPACANTNTVMYESLSGTVIPLDTLLFVSKEAFANTLLTGYTEVYLRSNSLRAFELDSEEYQASVKELKENVSHVATDEVKKRYEKLMSFAYLIPGFDAISPICVVQTADENTSFTVLNSMLSLFYRFKYVLSLPFLIVCLAISCSVILRMTSDEAGRIGVQLALGVTNNLITLTYTLFSVIPIAFGALIGFAVGCLAGEPVFFETISKIWVFIERPTVFRFGEGVGVIMIMTVLICIAAVVSCRFVLKRNVPSLLNGAKITAIKTAFYEKTKAWKKLSLLTKSIFNNIRTDRMRVTITLIGIVCCTALSISGLVMMRSISGGYTRQFTDVTGYDTLVFFDMKSDAGERITERLAENGITSTSVYEDCAYLRAPDGGVVSTEVLVFKDNPDGWLTFRSSDGKVLDIGEDALLTRSYADYYDIAKGSAVTFTDGDGLEHDVKVDGVFDYYLVRQQLVFQKERYEDLTGKTVENNVILVSRKDLSASDIDALLQGINGYYRTYDYKDAMYMSYTVYKSLGMVISCILIVLSLSISVFMLLNLFVQFVNEKKREIITMMINGYDLGYVRRYIYLDTIFLGVTGLAFGAVLGNILGVVDVNTMYTNMSYFPQGVDFVACLEGMGITAVFTAVMCIKALKQIKHFGISDLNKA